MAGLGFGSFTNSLHSSDFYSIFNGIKSIDKIDDEPALFGDMLGLETLDFDDYPIKDEVLDLFAPSSLGGGTINNNADDLLDKLISELDRVEQEYPPIDNNDNNSSLNSSQFSNSTCFTNPTTFLQTNSGFSRQCHQTEDFCFDQTTPLSPPAETIEIEYIGGGAEHSYASSDEKTGFIKPIVNSSSQVVGSSGNNTTTGPTGSLLGGCSSSSSLRSTSGSSSSSITSTKLDGVQTGLGYRWNFAPSISPPKKIVNINNNMKRPQPYHNLDSKTTSPYKKSSSVEPEDMDDDDDAMDGDLQFLPSDYNRANFGAKSYAKGRIGAMFERCNRKSIKSQLGSAGFGAHDFRREDRFQTLYLSDEERELCEKEGIKLPTKFPLTKQEERDLRRIRRKIRNKRSAQESRRKKHEYILTLEDRMRHCDRQNLALRQQVENLSKSNKNLSEQLRKLQSAVGNGNIKPTVQAGTCLAVLLLSFALLVAPNYNMFGNRRGSGQNKMHQNQNNNNRHNSFGSRFNENDVSQQKSLEDIEAGGFGGQQMSVANKLIYSGNTRTLQQVSLDEFDSLDSGDDAFNGSLLSSLTSVASPPLSSGGESTPPSLSGGKRRGSGDDTYWWDGDGGGEVAPPLLDDDWLLGLGIDSGATPQPKRVKTEFGSGADRDNLTSVVWDSGQQQRGVKVEEY